MDGDNIKPSSSGLKLDDGKSRLDLLPPFAIAALGDVLTYGAKKYAPDNWRRVPDARRRYIAAALRHILQDMSGERCDRESGLPHISHALASLSFIAELDALAARVGDDKQGTR